MRRLVNVVLHDSRVGTSPEVSKVSNANPGGTLVGSAACWKPVTVVSRTIHGARGVPGGDLVHAFAI